MSKPKQMMLGILLRAWREKHRMGVRGAAKQIGISHATLSRIENGKATDGQTLWRVLNWLIRGETE